MPTCLCACLFALAGLNGSVPGQAVISTAAGKERLRAAVKAGKEVEDETAAIQKEICAEVRLLPWAAAGGDGGAWPA